MEAITAEPTSQLEHRERKQIADRVPGLLEQSVVKGAIPLLPHPFSAPARVRPALRRFALAAFALLTLSACDFMEQRAANRLNQYCHIPAKAR